MLPAMSMTTPDITAPATKKLPCPICAYASEHHWWGPELAPARSHCSDCHRSWTSLVEGHCTLCCENFANIKAFDAHLAPEGGCVPPESVIRRDGRPRLSSRTSKWGRTWKLAFYGTRPDFSGESASDLEDLDEVVE
jgi:hypothetical protein